MCTVRDIVHLYNVTILSISLSIRPYAVSSTIITDSELNINELKIEFAAELELSTITKSETSAFKYGASFCFVCMTFLL